MAEIRYPDPTQHYASAGRTGSGKTVAGLAMLAACVDMDEIPVVIIDHKRDPNIKALPAEPLNVNAMILPSRGLHVIHADMGKESREDLEGFLQRAFKRGKMLIYIDEGHLFGSSDMVRNILVAGRTKKCSIWWTSQRATWIDPFIWSQAAFYRVFDLQTQNDIKRFNENFSRRWQKPAEHHSYYQDVSRGEVYYLRPSEPIEATVSRLDAKLITRYRAV